MHFRPTFLAAASALTLLLGAACAPSAAPATTGGTPAGGKPAAQATVKPGVQQAAAGDATRGKQLFTGTCSSCHGPEAKGLPNLGKDLTTSAFVKSETDQQLIDFIKKGRPASDPANTTKVDMPPKGGNPALTDAQIADIVAFIRTINK